MVVGISLVLMVVMVDYRIEKSEAISYKLQGVTKNSLS